MVLIHVSCLSDFRLLVSRVTADLSTLVRRSPTARIMRTLAFGRRFGDLLVFGVLRGLDLVRHSVMVVRVYATTGLVSVVCDLIRVLLNETVRVTFYRLRRGLDVTSNALISTER